MGKPDEYKFVLISKEDQSNEYIAKKRHRQFAHPSLNQVVSLINNAGTPWSENKELVTELKGISN